MDFDPKLRPEIPYYGDSILIRIQNSHLRPNSNRSKQIYKHNVLVLLTFYQSRSFFSDFQGSTSITKTFNKPKQSSKIGKHTLSFFGRACV